MWIHFGCYMESCLLINKLNNNSDGIGGKTVRSCKYFSHFFSDYIRWKKWTKKETTMRCQWQKKPPNTHSQQLTGVYVWVRVAFFRKLSAHTLSFDRMNKFWRADKSQTLNTNDNVSNIEKDSSNRFDTLHKYTVVMGVAHSASVVSLRFVVKWSWKKASNKFCLMELCLTTAYGFLEPPNQTEWHE